MTDTPQPADLDMSPKPPSPWRNISVVWLVPVLALIVSLAVAWRTFAERGELVEILFKSAAGVEAGETNVRYRDVVIGKVEKVGFTDDLAKVIVSARIDKSVAHFLNSTAQFWVVRPEVSAEGVTGLSTVLTGVYIEASWVKAGGPEVTRFEGLEQRPLIDQNEKGTRITLQATGGHVMSTGTPVFYRGVRVGRTEAPRLDEKGAVVLVDAFIEAPHDRLLTTATRFWDRSGFSVSFGAEGLKLDVGSFAALISGGVAFNTFFMGGQPVKQGQIYDLYPDETSARENAFSRVSTNTVTVATIFDSGVAGLAPGASLNYKGLKIGEVETISAFVSGEDKTLKVQQLVTLKIDPDLLGLHADATLDDVLDFLSTEIGMGLRAQLNTANLLSSSLIVELAKVEDAKPAVLDRKAEPFPIIPSVETDLHDLNATLEGVMKRINSLKIEELIQQAITTMAGIESVAADKSLRDAPKAFVGLMDDARGFIDSEETRALPGELRAAIAELRDTITRINDEGVVERLVSTLQNADAAMANVSAASDDLPALIQDLRDVAAKAKDLKAEELVDSVTTLVNDADKVINTEGARELPAAFTGALDEMRDLLAELRQGGAVENTNEALASVRSASVSLQKATAELPALAARLDQLVARAEALIRAYGSRSDFNSETLAMLREVRAAARTITSLTRALERNPSSILFGK